MLCKEYVQDYNHFDNQFIVISLCYGKIIIVKHTFLSPIVHLFAFVFQETLVFSSCNFVSFYPCHFIRNV